MERSDVTEKLKKLLDGGKKQSVAVAIALSMAKRRKR